VIFSQLTAHLNKNNVQQQADLGIICNSGKTPEKPFSCPPNNYFHGVKIYFHDLEIYFQALKIIFHALKIAARGIGGYHMQRR